MYKNRTPESQKQNQKGRVLARELSEELRKVQGGYELNTFTQVPWDGFDRD